MKVWHRFWMRWHLWHGDVNRAYPHWTALGRPRPKTSAFKWNP